LSLEAIARFVAASGEIRSEAENSKQLHGWVERVLATLTRLVIQRIDAWLAILLLNLLRRALSMYAACTDIAKVKLDRSARFGESLQPGTVMWECQGKCARHNRPSPSGALERAQGDVATSALRRCHASRPLSCKKRPRGRIGRKMRTTRTKRKSSKQPIFYDLRME
jgi:hypothetical protein